jgi:hypothetical protein
MSNLTDLPELMTPAELAQVMRRTTQSLAQDRYLRKGVPFHRVGGKILYSKADVLSYLDAGRVQPCS